MPKPYIMTYVMTQRDGAVEDAKSFIAEGFYLLIELMGEVRAREVPDELMKLARDVTYIGKNGKEVYFKKDGQYVSPEDQMAQLGIALKTSPEAQVSNVKRSITHISCYNKSLSPAVMISNAKIGNCYVVVDETGAVGNTNMIAQLRDRDADIDIAYTRMAAGGICYRRGEKLAKSLGIHDRLANWPTDINIGTTVLDEGFIISDKTPVKRLVPMPSATPGSLTFFEAGHHMQAGSRIARLSWINKYVWLVPSYMVMGPLGNIAVIESAPALRDRQGKNYPGWTPSNEDFHAHDWVVLPEF